MEEKTRRSSPPEMKMDKIANPAPLGLMGFGMTTVLLNLSNAGVFPLDTMILAMGIFYGGLAQVLAGIMEFKNGNTFGTTAFTSYGLFWLSFAALIVFSVLGWATKPTDIALAAYLFMWGLFTAYLFLGTLKLNKALQAVFLTLTALFWLLALSHLLISFGNSAAGNMIKTIAGYEGIFCGFSAIYLACAQVLNEVYKKEVLPV